MYNSLCRENCVYNHLILFHPIWKTVIVPSNTSFNYTMWRHNVIIGRIEIYINLPSWKYFLKLFTNLNKCLYIQIEWRNVLLAQCEVLSSQCVCLNFLHFNLFLTSQWPNWNQTWYICYLGILQHFTWFLFHLKIKHGC